MHCRSLVRPNAFDLYKVLNVVIIHNLSRISYKSPIGFCRINPFTFTNQIGSSTFVPIFRSNLKNEINMCLLTLFADRNLRGFKKPSAFLLLVEVLCSLDYGVLESKPVNIQNL